MGRIKPGIDRESKAVGSEPAAIGRAGDGHIGSRARSLADVKRLLYQWCQSKP
jgi:hypothetical protein